MTLLLELSGITKAYGGAPALSDLSLAVGAGEYLSILGPSGSGKIDHAAGGRRLRDAG